MEQTLFLIILHQLAAVAAADLMAVMEFQEAQAEAEAVEMVDLLVLVELEHLIKDLLAELDTYKALLMVQAVAAEQEQ
jgi:hypothetical protein